MPDRPLVSFVIIGRNDDYMGDYLYRLGTSLSFLAESAERAGALSDIEVLVVDWASERPLAAALPLTPAARRITSFLQVTPEIVQSRFGAMRWLPTCAVNVGVRRARGGSIFFTDSDCLWTETAVSTLGRLLRGEIGLPSPVHDVLCYVRRYQIPWATVHRRPHLDEWRRLSALLAAAAVPEYPSAACLGGFSAGQLMHRDLWFEARGYDESLDRPWGWSDNDLMLRISQEHAWLDVSSYGFSGLHMEHWPQAEGRFRRDPSTVNPMIVRNELASNGPDWGLGDIEIPVARGTSATTSASGFGCAVPLSGQTAATLAPDWQPGPDAAALVRRTGADRELPSVPFDRLAAVAQIASNDLPRSVYFFGAVNPAVLLTIVKACPAAELFFVNPWPEGISDKLPFNPGTFSGFLEANCSFRGWARIVQGPGATAFERIDRSSVGPSSIELAWVGPDTPAGLLGALANRLAPGGVALFPLAEESQMSVASLQDAMPGCVTQSLGSTGLVASTRMAERRASDDVRIENQLTCS